MVPKTDIAEAVRIGLMAIEKGSITGEQFAQAFKRWHDQGSGQGFRGFLIAGGFMDVQKLSDGLASENTIDHVPTADSQLTNVFSVGETTDLSPLVDVDSNWSYEQSRDSDRFRIVKQHAQGGLGVVFVARDSQLNRDVALKQIRSDKKIDSESKSRFLVEAEITGQLEHPGIVPVYALGIDKSGNAFYAMRFVRGNELKSFIREFHSNIEQSKHSYDGVELRQLLRRFTDICNAIEYAHSRGILHRDLKPSNVMLGSHGETLVVDWGLAKILPYDSKNKNDRESVHNAESRVQVRSGSNHMENQYGTFSGTIPYASPEQLEGLTDQFCAASDVYSLGAILYEILTNQPPIATRPDSIRQVIEWIRDEKVPRAEQLVGKVPRPLSMICQKAMRFELSERYTTARDLALDVERWLADERVLAFGDQEPIAETVGRWMRRYRSWTVPVAVALITTMMIAVVGSWLINQARVRELAAKQNALEYKNEAVERIGVARNAIDTMLIGSSESLSDFPMTRDLQKRFLEVALEDYAKLSETGSKDDQLELERIRAKVRVADIRHMQRDYVGAEQYYDSAIDELNSHLHNRSRKDKDSDMYWQIELGKTIGRKGMALDIEGRSNESKTLFANSIDLLRSVVLVHIESERANLALARQLIVSANSTANASEPAVSIKQLEESISKLETFDTSKDMSVQMIAIQAKESLARAYGKVGRISDAIQSLDQAIDSISVRVNGANKDREVESTLASIYVSRANLKRNDGDFSRAMADLVTAKDNYDVLRSEWPDSLELLENSALTGIDIGLLQLDLQKPFLALDSLRISRDQYAKLQSDYPRIARYTDGLATALSGMGQGELQTNPEVEVAVELLVQSLRLFEQLAKEANAPAAFSKSASLHGQLGQALHRDRDWEGARQQFVDSQSLFQAIVESDNRQPAILYSLSEVEWQNGWLEWETENFDLAKMLYARSIERLRALTKSYPENGQYHERLASFLVQCPEKSLRGFDEANNSLQQAIAQQGGNLLFLSTLGECKAAMGQLDASEKLIRSLAERRQTWSARDYGVLAMIENQRGQVAEAKISLQRSREIEAKDQPFDMGLNRWIESIQKSLK